MSANTKIYRVMAQDHMVRYWHFASKSAAHAFAKEWNKENNSDGDYGEPEIEVVTVPLNARGIAEALDDFISMTCVNEG